KQTEKKFDTHISMAMNTYVFIQFVITLGITSWFLFTYETMTLSSGLIVMAFVLISITATGLLLEGNRWAVFVERLRLIGLPLVFFYLHYIGFFGIIPVRYYNPLLAYVVVSLIIFTFILRRNSLHVKNIK
ncbi:MAG: hypothetical protein K1X40_09680, partial [Chitinophagales bacterium]|nr:hypothetical protein [Chitinophagales bacterium]